MKQVLCSIAHSIILLVILGYYYAINQVKKVLFLQHFLFFWGLLCKQFIFWMKIIRNPSFRWYELSRTHLAFDMNCREPILIVFREAAILWIFSCFCCLCRRPDEAQFGQRQLSMPWNQDFAASDFDPMMLTLVKGSYHALRSRFCCFRLWPDETCQDQRQQTLLIIKILLLPTLTQWNPPGPKAANTSHNQDFAAFAVDPMKPAKTKGSKHFL